MGYVLPPHPATEEDTGKMPWPVTAATLTAMLGLYFTAGPLPLLGVFALLGLASYFFRARLVGGTMLRWAVRGAFIILVLLLNQEEPTTGDYSLGSARVRNIFGQLYAAEWVVQCWRQRPGDASRSSLQALLASGFLLLTACNTFDENYARYITPLYMAFAGISLYHYRFRPVMGTRITLIRAGILLVAIGMGAALHRTFLANRGNLTEWGNKFLGDHVPFEATGMASQPSLGATFGLRGSAARVLKIEGFTGDSHLRGMAFDTYDSGRWGPSFLERTFRPATPQDLHPTVSARKTGTITDMRVTRVVSDNPLLFAPLQTTALDKGEAEGLNWAPDSGGPFRVRMRPPYEYTVTVSPRETYQGLLARPLTRDYRARCLQIPERFDPRLRDLAKQITRGKRTEAQRIEAVVGYLIENHAYSLSIQPGTVDPLVGFLLSEPKKGAHCEYFASASAMLLRCVGIPTRYVTGYFAHEGDGKAMIVRQKDAHAWSEAWVQGIGWVTVEATPGDGRPDGDKTPVEPWRLSWEWLQDKFEAFGLLLGNLSATQVNIGIGLIIGGGFGYALWRYYLKRRQALMRAIPGFHYSPPTPNIGELVSRFEAAYARRGIGFPPEQTYRGHLAALTVMPIGTKERGTPPMVDVSLLTELGTQFVNRYDRVRFGNQTDTETIEEMRSLIQEIENTPL